MSNSYRHLLKRVRVYVLLIITFVLVMIMINNSTTILKLVYPLKYKKEVFNYSNQSNVDPYLVFAIIKAESGFDPKATSRRNARGLMQISERTGKWGADSLKISGYTVNSLYDPDTNIRIGCWYLKRLMKEFNNDTELVIIAYNGGSGNLNEWLKDEKLNLEFSKDKIPFKETRAYLKRVKDNYSVYKKLYE